MSAFLLATGHCPCSAQLSGYTPTIINHGEPYDSLPGRKIVARRRFHVIQNHGMWYMVCGMVNAYINPWPYSWIDDPLPLWEYKPCFDPGTFNIIQYVPALKCLEVLPTRHLTIIASLEFKTRPLEIMLLLCCYASKRRLKIQ
jgi:hypothetical protein